MVRAERRIRPQRLGNHRTEAGIRAEQWRTERRLQIHRLGPGKLPERHPENRRPRRLTVDRPGENAEALSGHFAVILDNEVQSRPIINFAENPDGIDGRQGAQISGGFNGEHGLEQAQELATTLQIGALPIELRLISETQVSATLGSQALHDGIKAGIIGLALVILFLLPTTASSV